MIIKKTLDTTTSQGILLFIGAVGKFAQIGLHTWSPDAMEGCFGVVGVFYFERHTYTYSDNGGQALISPKLEMMTIILGRREYHSSQGPTKGRIVFCQNTLTLKGHMLSCYHTQNLF